MSYPSNPDRTPPKPPYRPPQQRPSQPPPASPQEWPPSTPPSAPQQWPPSTPPASPQQWPPASYPAPPPPPPVYVQLEPARRGGNRRSAPARRRRGWSCLGCLPFLLVLLLAGMCLGVYALIPFSTNLLVLGIDYAPDGSMLGRSDTNILMTFNPFAPYVGMLSIPRDLWVTLPDGQQNRINTAHYYGEGVQPGAGPRAALDTIRSNFGVDVSYYFRVNFEGFKDVIDAMGGVDLVLDAPRAGYEAGRHHLTGRKALAFARHRAGADDFYRMENGQILLKAAFTQMLNPLKWPRLPGVLMATARAVDTNLPVFLWPRLGMALLRTGPQGIDNRTIAREMVIPYVTDQGAQVLMPNWDLINPVLFEMFGQ